LSNPIATSSITAADKTVSAEGGAADAGSSFVDRNADAARVAEEGAASTVEVDVVGRCG
jgi:hypothetical protein